MHDEILAHRLGLVPFNIDPDFFEKKEKDDEFAEENCLKFFLHVTCKRKSQYANYTRE